MRRNKVINDSLAFSDSGPVGFFDRVSRCHLFGSESNSSTTSQLSGAENSEGVVGITGSSVGGDLSIVNGSTRIAEKVLQDSKDVQVFSQQNTKDIAVFAAQQAKDLGVYFGTEGINLGRDIAEASGEVAIEGIRAGVDISQDGLATAEALGRDGINAGVDIAADGLATAESLGRDALVTVENLNDANLDFANETVRDSLDFSEVLGLAAIESGSEINNGLISLASNSTADAIDSANDSRRDAFDLADDLTRESTARNAEIAQIAIETVERDTLDSRRSESEAILDSVGKNNKELVIVVSLGVVAVAALFAIKKG